MEPNYEMIDGLKGLTLPTKEDVQRMNEKIERDGISNDERNVIWWLHDDIRGTGLMPLFHFEVKNIMPNLAKIIMGSKRMTSDGKPLFSSDTERLSILSDKIRQYESQGFVEKFKDWKNGSKAKEEYQNAKKEFLEITTDLVHHVRVFLDKYKKYMTQEDENVEVELRQFLTALKAAETPQEALAIAKSALPSQEFTAPQMKM